MLFENIAVLNRDFTVSEHQYVAVKDTHIAYVGAQRPQEDYGESYAGAGKLLMSGFVNAHTHTPMTLLRGYAENLPLDRWLNERVFPFEDQIHGEDAYYAALLAIAEMIRTGTTSFFRYVLFFGGRHPCGGGKRREMQFQPCHHELSGRRHTRTCELSGE